MSDYSAVAPPPQPNFNQSTAFAAALQRAKQIAAKINPVGGGNQPDIRPKRPLEDGSDNLFLEPDAKKGPGLTGPPNQGPPSIGRPSLPLTPSGMGGPVMGGGPQMNEDIKVPDKMVGLRMNNMGNQGGGPGGMGGGPGGMGGGPGLGGGGRNNSVEIMIPGPKVGLIIGKGGEMIKQLQEKSGAKMVVIQDGPNQENEKPLRISGDPQKVDYGKQLVYELLAEKEMQNFNRGGGGGGRGGGHGGRNDRGGGGGGQDYNDYGNGGGGNECEVLVPRQAVGVVIGKGGDMIKKIQAETGARVQFHQAREEGPGERRCSLSGNPKQVEQARQRIEELIDSVHQRDNEGGGGGRGHGGGRGGRGGGRGGRGGGGGGNDYGGRGNRNGGGDYDGGGGAPWEDRRSHGPQGGGGQEVTFTVPSSKCGVIIGRGGETIKQINQQSGAYCELDRRSQNGPNSNEKTFTIKGDPDQIESAKRIISDKVQMSLTFIPTGGPNMSSMPTAYPGMAPQGYNPQGGWGNFQQQQQPPQQQQQQWGGPNPGGDSAVPQQPGGVQVNPGTGQPDYSLQWADYYRSLGMHREAEMIEQQAKQKTMSGAPPTGQNGPPAVAAAPAAAPTPGAGQPDYSAQWAEYYRSIGKHKEAEAIESQMKNKTPSSVPAAGAGASMTPGPPGQAPAGSYQQQAYGAYQPQAGGYYGGQPQGGVQPGVPQGGYGFPAYGYGGPGSGGAPSGQDN